MKKRLLALAICLVMMLPMFASCAPVDLDYKGPILQMYLTQEIYDFDPLHAYNNEAQLKVVSLLFATLFKINEKGQLDKGVVEHVQHGAVSGDHGMGEQFAADKEGQAEQQRSVGDGQTIIILALAAVLGLADFFHNIKVSQTDETGQCIADKQDHLPGLLQADGITDAGRQNTKAGHIGQRVDLNTKALFFVGTLAGTGDGTVEHITETAEDQECDGKAGVFLAGHNTAEGECKAQVSNDDRVVVET